MYKELDVSRWATDNLHLVSVELLEEPVRVVINVYACNSTMEEQYWIALDNLQTIILGETILVGTSMPGSRCGLTLTPSPTQRERHSKMH